MECSPLEKEPSKKEIAIASVPLLIVCAVALVFFLIARGGGHEADAVSEEDLEWIACRMNLPDYVWIQGVQISTANTALHIISHEHRFSSQNVHVYRMRLTDEDIVPLSNMTNLTRLTLKGHSISDISSLAGLTNLESLWLDGSEVSDISPLAGLTSLESLNLEDNLISDIYPLEKLPSLRSLYLLGNLVTDWSLVDHVESVGGRPSELFFVF